MRPRFSLKALLVLVTLIALALAFVVWQQRIVDDRRALLSEILTQGGGYMAGATVANNTATIEMNGTMVNDNISDRYLQAISNDPGLVRRWLGDKAMREIWLPNHPTSAELAATVSVVFPEAQVRDLPRAPVGAGTITLKGPGVIRLPISAFQAPQN